jgi:hypothetical protein
MDGHFKYKGYSKHGLDGENRRAASKEQKDGCK